jgi:hypothetical protein
MNIIPEVSELCVLVHSSSLLKAGGPKAIKFRERSESKFVNFLLFNTDQSR